MVAEEAKRGNEIDADEAERLRKKIWNVTKSPEKRVWIPLEERSENGLKFIAGCITLRAAEEAAKEAERIANLPKLVCSDDDVFRIGKKVVDEETIAEMEWMEPRSKQEAVKYLCELVGYEWDAQDALENYSGGWLFDLNKDETVQGTEIENERKREAKRLVAAAEQKERSERLRETIAEYDERQASQDDQPYVDEFIDQVCAYLSGVHRLRRMQLFQNFYELLNAFPDMNIRDAANAITESKHSSDRENCFIEFMIKCRIIVQVSVHDGQFKRVAYHGAAITFDEAKSLRDDLKAEAKYQKQLIEQIEQLPKAA